MLRVYHHRRLHRRLAVVLGVQLLLWVVSGLYFTWSDLDRIHGDHLRAPRPALVLPAGTIGADAAARAAGAPDSLTALDLVAVLGEPFYRVRFAAEDGARTVLVHAVTARVRAELTAQEAEAVARASFVPDAPASVRRLVEGDVGPHHEYRGGPLPAWQVAFGHESGTRVYVSAADGQVASHRNTAWRVFDFLWMLHTMDFAGRDDINNPVLRGVASLALPAVLSGFVLWGVTAGRRRRGA